MNWRLRRTCCCEFDNIIYVLRTDLSLNSILSMQMAKRMKNQGIAAVVCLGFSTSTLVGRRCQADDALLDLNCNVLFVVGENAFNTRSVAVGSPCNLRRSILFSTVLLFRVGL